MSKENRAAKKATKDRITELKGSEGKLRTEIQNFSQQAQQKLAQMNTEVIKVIGAREELEKQLKKDA